MSRARHAIPVALSAALVLAGCAAPRAVLMPAPPPELRREAGAPPEAARRPAPPEAGAAPGVPAAAKTPGAGPPPPGASPGVPAEAKAPEDGAPPAGVAPQSPAGEAYELPARLSEYAATCDRTSFAIARGETREVVPLWRALEDSKWGTDAVYNQGVLLQLAGDLDGAAAQYRRALDRTPGFEPALANLLGIAMLRGDREQMESVLASAAPPRSPPRDWAAPELGVNAAAALMETGRREDAARVLHALRAAGKQSPALSWNLAVQSFRTGDLATARDLAGKVPPAVAGLFPVVASRFAWARDDERPPALGAPPAGMPGMAGLSANLAAFGEYRGGRIEAAEKKLSAAAAEKSASAEILTNIGMMQAERGRWTEARRNLEQAVRVDPALAAGWLNLGIFREVYEGNVDGARECYEKYVKINGFRKEEVRKWAERLGQSASPQQ